MGPRHGRTRKAALHEQSLLSFLLLMLGSGKSNHPMRKWLLNLHLYGGLLCAPYLLIFGFSSLHFNHHFSFVEPKPNSVTWHAPLAIEPLSDNDKMAMSIRDSMGLMGWTIPWKMKRDAAGVLEFDLERPGK